MKRVAFALLLTVAFAPAALAERQAYPMGVNHFDGYVDSRPDVVVVQTVVVGAPTAAMPATRPCPAHAADVAWQQSDVVYAMPVAWNGHVRHRLPRAQGPVIIYGW